jgi:molybdopterin converting factor small subunit
MTAAGGIVVVRVRCFGFGHQPSRVRERTLTLPKGATVSHLLAQWREEDDSALANSLLVILNGRVVQHLQEEATQLSDGDEVTLMQPAAGG